MPKMTKCHELIPIFDKYINCNLSELENDVLKKKIDTDDVYWECWNHYRWERSRNSVDLSELEEYLGSEFIWGFDSSWDLANKWYLEKRDTINKINSFYSKNKSYLYNLIIWEASGQRPKYVESISEIINELKISTICDFGCGVGTDGLKLMNLDKEVIFCDINVECINFLKWRLRKRNIDAEVIPPQELQSYSFDTLWLMDVIEHLPHPIENIIGQSLMNVKNLIYDSQSTDFAGGRHPFHMNHTKEYLDNIWREYNFIPYKRVGTINILKKRIIS